MRSIQILSISILMSLFSIQVEASCDSTASLGSIQALCVNEDTAQFNVENPSGGYYYGNGILDSSGSFLPSLVGAGTITIFYVYTDSLGCSDTASQSLLIINKPSISLSAFDSVCYNESVFQLTQGSGSTSGFGVYSGTGIVGTDQFNASVADTGITSITYTFTDSATTCSHDTSANIFVKALPVLNFPAFGTICLGDDSFSLNSATPSGGLYYGIGVQSDSATYIPDSAGIFQITYRYTDNNSSCYNIIARNLRVRALPNVSLNAISAFCLNDSNIQIQAGSPIGGKYWGTGITDSSGTFSPAVADTGAHLIYYRYSDAFSCKAFDSVQLQVNDLPEISLSSYGGICSNASPISLSQGSSSATGTDLYSGMGVLSGIFYPNMTGTGPNAITYSFTETSTGCTNSEVDSIMVYAPTAITNVNQSDYCENDEPDTLNFPSPSGGKFIGTGILSDSLRFDADVSGVGAFTITYRFVDSNTCVSSSNFNVRVYAKPNPTVSSQSDRCESDTSFVLTGQNPSGGTFSGTGVIGGTNFSPNQAGAGNWTLKYSYTNVNGCTDSSFFNLKVNANPNLSFSTIPDFCEDAGRQDLTSYVSADSSGSGTFSGSGMLNASTFSPNVVGDGSYQLNYSFVDNNSCEADTTISIQVLEKPALSLSPFDDFCVNESSDTLDKANIRGGRYFGPGLSNDSLFNPASAGVGVHSISYTFTNSSGCADTATGNLEVFAIPNPSFSLVASVCDNGFPRALSGTPTGGTFSGQGVFNSTFYPDSVTAGSYNIQYSYTDSNGCTAIDTNAITVRSAPSVSLSNIPDICYDAGSVTLNQGSPAGGVYFLKGVSGAFSSNTLDLYQAGSGTFQVVYYYVDANACVDTAKSTITIDPQPNVGLSLRSSICENVGQLNLNGGSPAGGTYFGTSVNGTQFDPVSAGVGSHSISYTLTDANGCKDTATSSIQVNAVTAVTMASIPVMCQNDPPLTLNQGSPTGGNYSGVPGLIAGNLYPNLAGAGNFVLTYSFTNASGCTSSDTSLVKINPLPQVNIASQWKSCAGKDSVLLTGGTPSGGRYLGNFVDTNGFFYPDSSGVGAFLLSYEYTDTNTCSNSASQLMVVNPLPFVGFSPLTDKCVNESPFFITGGFPFGAGGRYRGAAVDSAGIFDPSTAGVGRDTIWYIYTDANACSDSTYQSIEVFGLPQLNATAIPEICIGSDAINLNYVVPGGGTYSGVGVVGNQFLSTIADTGFHQLNYHYSDSNSCTSDTSLLVRVNGLPDSRASNDTTVCKNTELRLEIDGGVAYQWEDGSEEQSVDLIVDRSQLYRVTVTSAENCERVHEIGVFLFDTMNVRPNVGEPDCGVSNGSVSVNVSGGQLPYRFRWNNGVESSTINNLKSGVYILTVSDQNACEIREVVSVPDKNAPFISIDSIAHISCYGDVGGYVQISSATGTQFSWSNFKQGTVLSNVIAGTYLAEVVDSIGCRNYETVIIQQPARIDLEIDDYLPTCGLSDGLLVANAEGGISPYTFSWSTGPVNDSLAGIPAGQYLLTVTDQNACSRTRSIELSDWGAPAIRVDSLMNPDCGQNNGQIQLSALDTGNFVYAWSNSSSLEDQLALAAGLYSVTISASNQCKAIRGYSLESRAPDRPAICLVSSDTATGVNQVFWNGSSSSNSWRIFRSSLFSQIPDLVDSLSAGTSNYTDTLFNSGLRSSEYMISAVNACGAISDRSTLHKTLYLTSTRDRNNFVKLSWNAYSGRDVQKYFIYRHRGSVGLELIDSVSGQVLNYTDLNSFVEASDYYYFIGYRLVGDCDASNYGFSNQSADYSIPGLGMLERESSSWTLHPNPSRGVLNIKFSRLESAKAHIKILNLQGAVLFNEQHVFSGDDHLSLELSHLAQGSYLIQVRLDNENWMLKPFVIN